MAPFTNVLWVILALMVIVVSIAFYVIHQGSLRTGSRIIIIKVFYHRLMF